MACRKHNRVLQWNQRFVRYTNWILHGRVLSHHVSRTKVWIPLGRWSQREDTIEGERVGVHRLPDDVGRELIEQRKDLPMCIRCPFPKELPQHYKGDIQTTVPSVCAHLPHPLSTHHAPECRDPPEHLFQALYILHWSVQFGGCKGAGTSGRADSVI